MSLVDNELYHHGILGMRWGVRRYQNKDGSLTPRGRKRLEQLESEAGKLRGNKDGGLRSGSSSSSVTSAKYKRSDAAELSDEELNARIKRLDLERRYKDALPKEQEHRSKGKVFVEDILNPALKEGAKNLTKKIVNNAVDAVGDTVGKKIKNSIEGSLKAKLGLEDKVIDTTGYKLSDISKLSTKELEERNSRLKAETAYKAFFEKNKKDQQKQDSQKNDSNQQKPKEPKQDSQKNDSNQPKPKEPKQDSQKNDSNQPKPKDNDNHSDTSNTQNTQQEIYRSLVKVEKPYARIYEHSRYDDAMSFNGSKSRADLARAENIAKAQDANAAKRKAKAEDWMRQLEDSTRAYLLSQPERIDNAKKFIEDRYLDEDWVKIKHSDMNKEKTVNTWRDELYHHGIRGQKWGVRRFQPYPSGYHGNGKYVGKKAPKKKVKEGNPILLFYAATYGTLVASIAGKYAYNQGKAFVKEHAAEKRSNRAEVDKKTGLKLKSKEYTAKQDMKLVNPGYSRYTDDVINNCVMCTTAFDLRRRGYEVTAGKISSGFYDSDYAKWYKGAKMRRSTDKDALGGKASNKQMTKWLKNEILQQGEGARGFLSWSWAGSYSGHSQAYIVENGKVQIYDAQCGKKMSVEKVAARADDVGYMRVDDKQPDYKTLKKRGIIQ